MTREEILKLAHEAGFNPVTFMGAGFELFERFAALVAKAEREECAKVCDARYTGDNNREDIEARRCAAAIRARGNK